MKAPPSATLRRCGAALFLISLALGGGCAGPDRGRLGLLRGRTALVAEAEEKPPPPLPEPAEPAVEAFPLYFRERGPRRSVLEVLWPLFERGRSSESSYFRLRPLYLRDRFRDQDRLVLFPFWWRLEERREAGDLSVRHLWPLYGVHRRWIDLAPATTHHLLFPIFYFRSGPGRWKARLLPVAAVSSGYLDRGWWLLPILKAGTGRGGWAGGNRFLYVLDPLLAFERFSIAGAEHPEEPADVRTRVQILGGLLGWERSGGRTRFRVFWIGLGG